MENPIKIAIVGEGPIGLIAVAKLIALNNSDSNAKPITIDWYVARTLFSRRHIVEINVTTIRKIEEILNVCNQCILDNDINKLITSIRFLEQTLFDKIPNAKCNGEENKKCILTTKLNSKFDQKNATDYDHVFLATGFASYDFRKKLINNDEDFDAVTYNIDALIFVFYGNLQPAVVDKKDYIKDLTSFKIKLDDEYISKFMNKYDLSALIATVYRFQKFGFRALGYERQNDRWINGFQNFADLIAVYELTFKSIREYGYDKYKKLMSNNNTNINPIQDALLRSIIDNTRDYADLFNNYKRLLADLFEKEHNGIKYDNLEGNAFMFHSVVPSAVSLGCSLYRENNIKYCNKYQNTNVWLIGDSANGYPPNESLERNAVHLLELLPSLYANYFTNSFENLSVTFDMNYIIENLINNIFCLDDEFVNNGYFKNGYLKGNAENYKNKLKIAEVINKIFPKNNADLLAFIDEDNYKTFYNIATFLSYINNLVDIRCNNSKLRSDIKLFKTYGGSLDELEKFEEFNLSLKKQT
jgi:hypothetical protein